MLTTILNTLPSTRFILIKDSLSERGDNFLDFIVKEHLKRNAKLKFFIFGSSFSKIKSKFSEKVRFYNFTSDEKNWLGLNENFDEVIDKINDNSIVVIDSIVHLIYLKGAAKTYQIINSLLGRDVQQIMTILHVDLIDNLNTIPLFEHLCTLYLTIEPNSRVNYTYKKLGGKIVKQIESYKFENTILTTSKIKIEIDKPEKLINETIPENLSTFKIGLTEKDQESKKDLVLPYLPREEEVASGSVHYTFDNIDDWDEEDPDDDLDI